MDSAFWPLAVTTIIEGIFIDLYFCLEGLKWVEATRDVAVAGVVVSRGTFPMKATVSTARCHDDVQHPDPKRPSTGSK